MSIKIEIRKVDGINIIDIEGEISIKDGSPVRDRIRELHKAGEKNFLVNLAGVDYVDSSGIGQLVSSYSTLQNHGGKLKLFGATARVKDVLKITRLLTVLEAFDNEKQALRSFG